MSNILLLEDDLSLINGLSFAFKKQGFESVSYTHLDVYKRQVQKRQVSRGQPEKPSL